MPTDDILWRKVNDLKGQVPEEPIPFAPASDRQPEQVMAAPRRARQQIRSSAREQDSKVPSSEGGKHASAQASMLAPYPQEWIETIRKAVKGTGKEVAFTRLTNQEKGQITDLVYHYRRQGMRTTENEVLRVGINLLLEDSKANGKQSILYRVIEALLS